MEFTLPLPQMKQDAAPITTNHWKNFNYRFRFFRKVQPKDVEIQVTSSESILLFLGGQSVIDVVKNLSNYHEQNDIAASVVLEMVSEICLPKFILLYERFKFFSCKQRHEECICRFLLKLLHLSELCEFEDNTDAYVAERIVHGVTDQYLRECLVSVNTNNLTAVLQACHQVAKCKDGQCCVNYTAYTGAFQEYSSQRLPETSRSQGDGQDAADTMSGRSDYSDPVFNPTMEDGETRDKPPQPDFWQFEDLIRNKVGRDCSSAGFKSTLSDVEVNSQAHGGVVSTRDPTAIMVKTEPLGEIIVKKECVSPSNENLRESKSHNSFWDDVAFDESDNDLDSNKGVKGSSIDGDSIDDVPVTVCAPVQNRELPDEINDISTVGASSSKKSDPIKIQGISRLRFAAKLDSPLPCLGTTVRSETNPHLPMKPGASYITLSNVLFTGNDIDEDCHVVAPIQQDSSVVCLGYPDDIRDKARSSPTAEFLVTELALPALSPKIDREKPTTVTQSFFDLYSNWMTAKPDTNPPSPSCSSGSNDCRPRIQGVVSDSPVHYKTRASSVKSARTFNSKKKLTPQCSRDDSESEDNKNDDSESDPDFDINMSEKQTGKLVRNKVRQELRKGNVKFKAPVDGQSFLSLSGKYNSKSNANIRTGSNKDVTFAHHNQDKALRHKTTRFQPSMAKNKPPKDIQSFFLQYGLDHPGADDNNDNVSDSVANHKTLVDQCKGKVCTKKVQDQTQPAVDVQSFFSQYGGYTNLMSDKDYQAIDSDGSYDYSDIVKKSVEEIMQEKLIETIKEPAEDTQSFFAQYDLQSKRKKFGMVNKRDDISRFYGSEWSSTIETGEVGEGKNKLLNSTVKRKRSISEDKRTPKLMRTAEKREVRTSEGAKSVTCLTLKL